MKVIIEGEAYFNGGKGDDGKDVDVKIVGAPDEDLDQGEILIVHPRFSLKVSVGELARALRPFQREPRD